jgi:hypothetical protein
MIDQATHDAIAQLATSRVVELDKSLKIEVGNIASDLADRGFSGSSQQVVQIKSAGERNLARRAELIKSTIAEVCGARNVRVSKTLRAELQELFDHLYQEQLTAVCPYIERSVPEKAKKLYPIGEIRPEIAMHRVELGLFVDRLPKSDYWENVVQWFRSRWWSVPIAIVTVCLPLLFQWVEMLKALLKWLGAIR